VVLTCINLHLDIPGYTWIYMDISGIYIMLLYNIYTTYIMSSSIDAKKNKLRDKSSNSRLHSIRKTTENVERLSYPIGYSKYTWEKNTISTALTKSRNKL